MTIANVEIIKNNCKDFAKTNKAVDVLKTANGKLSYIEVGKIVGLHKTKVSSLLNKAEKLGLVKKIKKGIYKRIPGVLDYIPNSYVPKNKKQNNNIDKLIKKIDKSKTLFKQKDLNKLILPSKINSSVDKMTKAYQCLYIVENSLRVLIRLVLENESDWWKNNIPSGVRSAVQETISNMPYNSPIRNDELEYTHLGQLKEIIVNKKNWQLFVHHLKTKDKKVFSIVIDQAIPLRNAIGHCIPLKLDDLKYVDMKMKEILKTIK